MTKGILGVLLTVFGGFGLWWWNNALWSSGGPDGGRSVIQYVVPYLLASIILFVGIYLCVRYVRKLGT
ncbi:hypothetical protein IM538_08375 [Cytobacillus suaedae]|nr:hypothetical protein IM538_08375 [Cytobacillus suaedae]